MPILFHSQIRNKTPTNNNIKTPMKPLKKKEIFLLATYSKSTITAKTIKLNDIVIFEILLV
jgi:hypothetical protein